MKKKTLLMTLFITLSTICNSQIEFSQNNNISVYKNGQELQNPWAGGLNFCQFSKIDLDLNGVNDLFVFDKSGKNGTRNGNKKSTFLFDTNTNTYEFAPEYINNFPELVDWALLVDYNQDLKADIFTSLNSSIALYTNNSNNELSFTFTKILTSDAGFGPINLYVSGSDIPAIVDVDGDNDIDILTFNPAGNHVYFHENKSVQMFGNSDSINLIRSDDCWGKFQEDFSTNSVTINLDNNCNEVNDSGRFARHSGSTLLAFDINPSKNQSLELLLGDLTYDNMVMLYNGGTQEEALITDQDLNFPNYNQSIDLTKFPGAFYLDINNDNLKDLIISPNGVNVSENHKNILLYENIGINEDGETQFNFIENDFLVKTMIDVGSNAIPILKDLNNDNLNDLIIANKGYFDNGNYNSSISIFENIGTIENPIFNFVTDDFANISTVLGNLPSVQALHPTFGDINNDGNIDMIIGDNNGELYLFKNDSSISSEWPTFLDYELLNIDVGSFAAPQLIDLNRDGLLDLVIGERMGIDNGVYNGVNYYQNIGSLTNPEFDDYTPVLASGELDENQNEIMVKSLGGIHLADPTYLTAYTAPQIFESNNEYHLAIGTEQGKVFLYDNLELVDNNTSTTILNLESEFNLITDDLLNNTNSIHSKIAIQDLNNDNLPDVIRGNASGGLELFLANSFNISSLNTNLEKIEIFPNPNNGNFNIKLPLNNNGNITIYSILGKIILNKKITFDKEIYQISNIKSGIYIISIKTENQTYTKKIIVNN